MQHIGRTLTGLAILGLAGCAQPNTGPRDVGSMAIPAPVATGLINRPAVAAPVGSATGTMAVPAPVPGSGVLTPAPTGRDTGTMAIPNSSQGNLRTRTP